MRIIRFRSRKIRLQLFILCTALALLAPVSWSSSIEHPERQSQLCPKAAPVPWIVVQGRKIHAPSPIEEERLLFRITMQGDSGRKEEAVAALALAGNIDAFQRLLVPGESSLLRAYARYYRNRDGSRCLDPAIEEAIAAHLNIPARGSALLLFLIGTSTAMKSSSNCSLIKSLT